MTASGISRILKSAGFRRSEVVPMRIVSDRTEGYTVDTLGENRIRIMHQFGRWANRRMSSEERNAAELEWLNRYKAALESRGYTVLLSADNPHSRILIVTQ